MSTFPVHGARLATEYSDEGGPAVVQLHGLTSSRTRDRILHLDLGRGLHGTRLLRFDARGHGASTGRQQAEDYRWSQLAQDLLDLLDDRFPGEQVHGVGPSMGCATLLHAAVLDPGRFSGFTLMVPPTAWETRRAKANDYVRAADLVERHGVEALVRAERMSPAPPATEGAPTTVPDVQESLLPSVLRGAALSDLPAPEALGTLTIRTTILAWTDDPAHPLSTARSLAQILNCRNLHIAASPTEVAQWPSILLEDAHRPAPAPSDGAVPCPS